MIRKSMPSGLTRGWVPVFARDKRKAFARRSCSKKYRLAVMRSTGCAIAERKLDDVVADVARPAGNKFDKTSSVVREQGPRGSLEVRKIAGHRRHEMIGRLRCSAAAIAIAAALQRRFDEFTQRHRRAPGLYPKP